MSEARVTRIIALRHGETTWNVDTRIQGQTDIPLNDTGRWQARRLARALAGEGISAVYTSDLLRARETAEALARALGVNLLADAGLRERAFGEFEGMTYDEIARRWPEASARWRERDPAFGPAGGETLSGFYARCVEAARRVAGRHPGQTIALVAHGGVLDCLYRAATRLDLRVPRTWHIGNASINRLLHSEEGFHLVGWADTQHLDDVSRDESADGSAAGR
jgi:probable phosphoglycerate mutase